MRACGLGMGKGHQNQQHHGTGAGRRPLLAPAGGWVLASDCGLTGCVLREETIHDCSWEKGVGKLRQIRNVHQMC